MPPHFYFKETFFSLKNLSKLFFLVFFGIQIGQTFLHYHNSRARLVKATLCSVLYLPNFELTS